MTYPRCRSSLDIFVEFLWMNDFLFSKADWIINQIRLKIIFSKWNLQQNGYLANFFIQILTEKHLLHEKSFAKYFCSFFFKNCTSKNECVCACVHTPVPFICNTVSKISLRIRLICDLKSYIIIQQNYHMLVVSPLHKLITV